MWIWRCGRRRIVPWWTTLTRRRRRRACCGRGWRRGPWGDVRLGGAAAGGTAEIAVRWARVEMRPPRSRADDALPTVTLWAVWAVWAHEQVPPPGVNALDWGVFHLS